MIDRLKLRQVVEQALQGTDLFVVDVTVSGDNVVEVTLDSMDDVTLDDCRLVNDAVLAAFDRDDEDFELTVGSYGLTSPLVLPRQFVKHIGRPVEMITRDGRKLHSTLTAADDNGCTIAVPTRVKPEGAKRPQTVDIEQQLTYNDIKQTKPIITV